MKILNKNYQKYLVLRLRYSLGNREVKRKSTYLKKLYVKTINDLTNRLDLLALTTDVIVLDKMYIITPRIGKFLGRNRLLLAKIEESFRIKIDFVKDDFTFNHLKYSYNGD